MKFADFAQFIWKKKNISTFIDADVTFHIRSKVLGTPVEIYNFSNINGPFTIKGSRGVRIGRYCDIAENLFIISSNHQVSKANIQARTQAFFNDQLDEAKGPVYIGNNVWVGDNVTILNGVSVGDGAALGANCVVTKDVKPFEIVAGVPAKHIKYRFNVRTRQFLLKTGWWCMSPQSVIANKVFFLHDFNEETPRPSIKMFKRDEKLFIDFSKIKDAEYLGSGWGPYEKFHRWAEKPVAHCSLYLYDTAAKYLQFNAISFEKKQQVTVTINRHSLGALEIDTDWQEYSIPLRKYARKGCNNIVFRFSYGDSPYKIKNFPDKRVLYCAFKHIKLSSHAVL